MLAAKHVFVRPVRWPSKSKVSSVVGLAESRGLGILQDPVQQILRQCRPHGRLDSHPTPLLTSTLSAADVASAVACFAETPDSLQGY
ncbi:hypothetical protein PF003_g22833 [Phytophthora fragariae]|nr:hypothetical protein PF003_g22833 [Phytophthora fragariae]